MRPGRFFICARRLRSGERGDPMPLWRSIARGGLVVAEVSGGHGDMIVEPNVQRAAAVLDERLASA